MWLKIERCWFKTIAVGLSLIHLPQGPAIFSSTDPSHPSLNTVLAPSSFVSVPRRETVLQPRAGGRATRRRRPSSPLAINTATPFAIVFSAALLGRPFSQPSVALAQENPTPPQDTSSQSQNESQRVQVVRVVDGDTIDVLINGVEERVRLIGIDAPEVLHIGEEVVSRDYYGVEAAEFCRSLIEAGGGRVRMEADRHLTDRCDYGRLLRYVWVTLPDPEHEGQTIEVLVNLALLKAGCADVYRRTVHQIQDSGRFLRAMREARDRHIGLWDREAARRWRSREKTWKEKLLDAFIFNREAEKIFSSV